MNIDELPASAILELFQRPSKISTGTLRNDYDNYTNKYIYIYIYICMCICVYVVCHVNEGCPRVLRFCVEGQLGEGEGKVRRASQQTTHLKSITTSEPIFGRRYAGKYACWTAGRVSGGCRPQPFVFISLRFGLFFCCCRAIYEMALKLFSVSACSLSLPPTPALSLSLSLFLLHFLLLFLFPVSVSAVAFPFTSFVPKQLTLALAQCSYLSNWSSAKMLACPLTPTRARTLRALPIGDCVAAAALLSTPRLFIARGSN